MSTTPERLDAPNGERKPVMEDDVKDILILRRGLSDQYYAALRIFAETHGLEIVVDRRRGERRLGLQPVPGDRRRDGRRGPVPGTWELADFVACKRKD